MEENEGRRMGGWEEEVGDMRSHHCPPHLSRKHPSFRLLTKSVLVPAESCLVLAWVGGPGPPSGSIQTGWEMHRCATDKGQNP